MRRHELHTQVYIRKVDNGYIVELPSEADYNIRIPDDGDDFRKKLFDKKFWAEIMQLMQKVKNNEPIDFTEEEAQGPQIEGSPMPEMEEKTGTHVFATYKEASDFINDFFNS